MTAPTKYHKIPVKTRFILNMLGGAWVETKSKISDKILEKLGFEVLRNEGPYSSKNASYAFYERSTAVDIPCISPLQIAFELKNPNIDVELAIKNFEENEENEEFVEALLSIPLDVEKNKQQVIAALKRRVNNMLAIYLLKGLECNTHT